MEQLLRQHGDRDRPRRHRDLVLPPEQYEDPQRLGQGRYGHRLFGQHGQHHGAAPPSGGTAGRRLTDRPAAVAAQARPRPALRTGAEPARTRPAGTYSFSTGA
ncbi:hypothetical protein SBRY_10329 [Actinacidiphila bryophytorum]|uniref:Uncharacterized protein n=1 Tax=Actinacidiphila bryophytorum TaxID=1436133 RepID=A0A9W4E633_9ACTN|nr:hypothetical protein SBRY_10329 [Actinacidiphila bryophytorum]